MLGNRIIELYNALGLNRTQFAKEINYTHSTIIKIEDGDILSLSTKLQKAICTAFPAVNPEWLKTGKGEMLLQSDHLTESDITQKITAICNQLPYSLQEDILRYVEFTAMEYREKKKTQNN